MSHSEERILTMYDFNITAQELSDYNADMAEMSGYTPTEEEMAEMAAFYGEE